jgi:hypothetical protein
MAATKLQSWWYELHGILSRSKRVVATGNCSWLRSGVLLGTWHLSSWKLSEFENLLELFII